MFKEIVTIKLTTERLQNPHFKKKILLATSLYGKPRAFV